MRDVRHFGQKYSPIMNFMAATSLKNMGHGEQKAIKLNFLNYF